MKTIEEQGREYAEGKLLERGAKGFSDREFNGCDIGLAYMDGIKAAPRWIPIDQEPDDKKRLLIALDYRGGVHTIFWEAIARHNRIIQNNVRDQTFKYYTHWLPIPQL